MIYRLFIIAFIVSSCAGNQESNIANHQLKDLQGDTIFDNGLTQVQYDIINSAYLMNTTDTVRPLKLFRHTAKGAMAYDFYHGLKISTFLIEKEN